MSRISVYGVLMLTYKGWKFIRPGNARGITYDLFIAPDNEEGLLEVLNQLAEMGWEVVTVVGNGTEPKYHMVYLKQEGRQT